MFMGRRPASGHPGTGSPSPGHWRDYSSRRRRHNADRQNEKSLRAKCPQALGKQGQVGGENFQGQPAGDRCRVTSAATAVPNAVAGNSTRLVSRPGR